MGLLGFSFAGGLALVAAEDPKTAALVSAVTSVGGHHDLRRVLRFLIHNEIETPHGVVRQKAHEYGLVVLVYGNLEHFVPATDLPAMRAGFKAWLHEDQKSARLAAEARLGTKISACTPSETTTRQLRRSASETWPRWFCGSSLPKPSSIISCSP